MPLKPELNEETEAPKVIGTESHFPLSYIAVLVCVLAAGAMLTGIILARNYRAVLNRTQVLLTRISEDTAQSIDEWVQMTSKQAEVMASFPAIVEATTSNDPKLLAHASAVLNQVRVPFDYAAIYAVDVNGVSKVQTADAPPLLPWLREAAARQSQPQTLTRFEPGPSPGFPQLAFLVPIEGGVLRNGRHERSGMLVIVTSRSTLAGLADTPGWNSDIRSVLFARNPQGGIVYFSHILHPPPAASGHDATAEAALRGESIFTLWMTGGDRGQYVVTGHLPELGWGMVTGQWQASVLAPFRQTVLFAVLIYLACSALLVALAAAVWRHQQVLRLREEMRRRAKTEEELRQSQELFNKAFRFCPDAMSLSRLSDGRFIEVNDSFLTTSGYSRQEVIGHSSLDMELWVDPADRAWMVQALQRNQLVRSRRMRGRIKDGSILEVELSAEVVQIGDEKCLLLVMRDITRQLAMEEQLRQAQKMEAVGQMAGAVAHDFNNLLMAISSQAELLLEASGPGDLEKRTRQIVSATQSAAKLTRKLLAFGRKQELATSAFDLNQLVAETADLIQHMIPPSIAVHARLASSPCWVKADRGQIEQTIMNLVINARDAMPDGGTLIISTSLLAIDGNNPGPHGGVPAGNYALITFTDTGHGIAKQDLGRIFEPFFTTKPKGRGTGLGLSIAYGILRQSGGHIRVRSTVGAGTTFFVYIPAVAQPHTDPPASHPCPLGTSSASCPQEGAILVVDDEELVRTSIRSFLGHSSLTVLDCANASEALRIVSELKQGLVLLVTDIVMPGMTGMELAQTLIQKMPDLPIIFISGYAAAESGHEQFRHARFLQKPFSRAEMMNAICEGLETCPFKRIPN